MLSRIASALSWMSRYLERVDNTAGIVDMQIMHMLEENDGLAESVRWRAMLAITESDALFAELHPGVPVSAQSAVRFMIQDSRHPGSIRASLRHARENARAARDRISNDMWECVNQLWHGVDRFLERPLKLGEAHEFCQHVRREVTRFLGITVNTMMRGEAFAFHLLGTFVERSDMTARILDVKYHLILPDPSMVGSPVDYYEWGLLLKSLSGFDAYRRKYQAGLRPLDIAGFLIFDADFPRSLAYSLDHIGYALRMSGTQAGAGHSADALHTLRSMLDDNHAAGVFESGLHEYLEGYLERVAKLSDAVALDFFEPNVGEVLCVT